MVAAGEDDCRARGIDALPHPLTVRSFVCSVVFMRMARSLTPCFRERPARSLTPGPSPKGRGEEVG